MICSAHAVTPCQDLVLTESTKEPDATNDFISYLAALLDQQIIQLEDMRRLEAAPKENSVVNPVANAEIDSTAATHHEGFETYLREAYLDPLKIHTWLQIEMRRLGNAEIQREEARVETAEPFSRMEFHFLWGA